ncbi:EamA family transporter RarD [Comamonas badia]|jgi:chloramphenicol-sensitive protein RarD|uniref:EamA family transporter RarD n=1 Tax=Comamonas badia TaxID=265291 RepID=UPI0004165CCC|nr:EamA family transporter RarD [Comamonas badia]
MWTGILVSVSASVLFAAMYYLAPWLAPLDGEQIFGWRVLCTLPFTSLILLARKQWPRVHTMALHALRNPAWGLALCASAALLGVQLWLFLWAPLQGRALAVSLGYFLLPLVMVIAGRLLFSERLSPLQWAAVLLAALGVLHEILLSGALSWETWLVALGYTVYFVARRKLGTDHLAGHWVDMALLVPPALWYVLRTPASTSLFAGHPHLWGMVPALGAVSAVALALYMAASRLLPLGLFGLLSYVEPILLALAALLLGERLSGAQWLTYAPIFAAVGVLVLDGALRMRASTGTVSP